MMGSMGPIVHIRSAWICFVFSIFLVSYSEGFYLERISLVPEPVLQWTQVEYKYPNAEEREKDIASGNFAPGTPAIIDVDVAFAGDEKKKTYFVTTPRFQAGIPATLGKVTNEKLNGNHLIEPYPNWNWHKNPTKCSKERLISVYRTQIDTCGRLWVLDNGNYQDQLICAPQILAFDLKTNKVVHRYEVPSNLLQSNSLFVTPVIDVTDGCQNTFVYAADCDANFLLVYDAAKNESWKIQDKSMYPNPDWGTYTILGESFELMDGILGMALRTNQERILFFHAMSSNTEHAVKVSDIRNGSKFKDSPNAPDIFYTYRGRRKSQSPAEAIDKFGILYFGDVNDVTLNCWDTSTEYGPRNIRILSNNQTILQFTSGMKVIDSGPHSQELYTVTSRFQKVALGTQNPKEVNFRVLRLQLNYFTKRKCS